MFTLNNQRPLRTGSLCTSLLALFAVAACTVGPDYKRPEVSAINGYLPPDGRQPQQAQFGSEGRNEAWWQAFSSEKLNATVEAALKGNLTIAEADASLEAAAAALGATRGASLPQIDATMAQARERINPAAIGFSGFPSRTIPRYALGVQVSYDLDLFGGNRRSRESAKALLDAESNRARAARLVIAGNVVTQAFEIAALQAQIEAENQIIESDKETLALAKRSADLGRSAQVNELPPSAQLAADQAVLPPLLNRLAIARNGLTLLLGQGPGTTAPDFNLSDFTIPAKVPVAVPSELVQARPDLRAAESALHAATANVGVKTANLFPRLSLTSRINQNATTFEDTFSYDASGWRVGADALAPLFRGGALRAQVRGAKASAEGAEARYRATVLRAFTEVSDALTGLTYATDELAARRIAVDTAQNSLKARRRLFELGRSSLFETLDAQRQANLAKREMAAAHGRYLTAFARLYAATASSQ